MPRMSRTKKSNRMKKEVLKSCLVAVLIGATGTIGSFAYFSSKATVDSNLTIKTGIINVKLNNHLHEDNKAIIEMKDLIPGGSDKSTFYIKNSGLKNGDALNEKVELEFGSSLKNLPSELLKAMNYSITFNGAGKVDGNMNDLIVLNKKIIPKDKKSGDPIELKPNETIECNFMVTLNKTLDNGQPIDEKYSKEELNFFVNATATQINNPSFK